MPVETWAAFVAATIILLVIPGPTILLVLSYALGQGARVALPMAAGVALGDCTALAVSMLGLGALLATSAELFTLLKWLGAAYLFYLGIKLWRAGGSLQVRPEVAAVAPWRAGAHACLVTALNPKSITFFLAFLPQFIDRSVPLLPQMLILAATFVTLAFVNAALYGLLAARARQLVRTEAAVRWVNRVGGTLLIGAGIATAALARRS